MILDHKRFDVYGPIKSIAFQSTAFSPADSQGVISDTDGGQDRVLARVSVIKVRFQVKWKNIQIKQFSGGNLVALCAAIKWR